MLNIRRDERQLVGNLFAIEFFQGAGIAFFFTSAFALFLKNFSINELPKVYILIAFMLWATVIIYTRFEHKIRVASMGFGVTIIMAFSIILFRLGCEVIHNAWFLYFMLAWFYVLYLLNSLEFWGIASLSFDVRQSKRLFGVISAGDIPVKFIGYSLASVVVTYIGTANLLYIGFIFTLLSLPFLRKITKAGYPGMYIQDHVHTGKNALGKIIKSFFKSFTANKLISRIAVLSFLFGLILFIVNFAFYSELKTAYHDDIDLARFISLFLAGSRIFALIMKMIFTGRMMTNLGFKRSLIFTPFILVLFIFMLFLSKYLLHSEKLIFYIFGMLAIAADLLRSSVHSPVFLTLMQPLATHDRLRAHNIVKGIMDPFAYLITGLLLLIMIHFFHHADLIVLGYILLVIIILFVINVLRVNKPYLQTLIHSISTRFFNEEDIYITDKESIQQISEKLHSGTDLEKMYILKLLEKLPQSDDIHEMIIQLLDSHSSMIQSETLKIIQRLNISKAVPFIRQIIKENSNPEFTAEALKVLCSLDFDENEILPLINHYNNFIQQSAITGVLLYGNDLAVAHANDKLKKLVKSNNPVERKIAAYILGEIKNGSYLHFLIPLMHDQDHSVMKQALLSAGKVAQEELIKELILQFPHQENLVIEALREAGEASLPAIKSYLLSGECKWKQANKLIILCGYIGGEKTCNTLVELLDELSGKKVDIIRVLHKCRFKADSSNNKIIEKLILQYFNTAQEIINIQKQIYPLKEEYHMLISSLKIELDGMKEILLILFSFLYGSETMKKIQIGFKAKKKESVANAMELVEMTIPKQFAIKFIHVFESEDPSDHSASKILINKSKSELEHVFHSILMNEEFIFSSWTKACCLYSGLNNNLIFHKNIIKKYINSDDILIQEIALSVVKI